MRIWNLSSNTEEVPHWHGMVYLYMAQKAQLAYMGRHRGGRLWLDIKITFLIRKFHRLLLQWTGMYSGLSVCPGINWRNFDISQITDQKTVLLTAGCPANRHPFPHTSSLLPEFPRTQLQRLIRPNNFNLPCAQGMDEWLNPGQWDHGKVGWHLTRKSFLPD